MTLQHKCNFSPSSMICVLSFTSIGILTIIGICTTKSENNYDFNTLDKIYFYCSNIRFICLYIDGMILDKFTR